MLGAPRDQVLPETGVELRDLVGAFLFPVLTERMLVRISHGVLQTCSGCRRP